MKTSEIIQNFSQQLKTNKPVVIDIKEQPGGRYTLRIAQQITPEADLLLNEAKPRIVIGFHHGLTKSKLNEFQITAGTVLETFDLSIWDSSEPMYAKQAPRTFTEGPFQGEVMTHMGYPYYRHVVLVAGVGRRDMWISDQILNKDKGITTKPISTKEEPLDNPDVSFPSVSFNFEDL
jgi:hypothetical protein